MLNNPAFLQKLTLWMKTKTEAAELSETERRLRAELFAEAFPIAKEGTNNGELPEGWKLKGVLKYNRTLDEAALPAVKEEVRALGFNPDPLIKYTPELVLKDYKALPDQIRHVFDNALTIKPGLPTIEIVAPKAKE